MVHRVRTHVWRNGRLEVKDAYFESVGEALDFAGGANGHSVKVYDSTEQLTHDLSPDVVANTYA
jgi:hypothetical protein